ncbi:hypothetical protein GJA_2344 [Janthinobacterium agaricidamnosum NBRC 102515 = DSM 9628]|uniref:Uncharacterized protein n=1 Tax=Janthinobacterium agaricidamnosum NBRC 102515 = DSM 9628 TaxID=1349767 RepID=W0V6L3_9BURK|nr:hypothetical protein GJA_2344 [Janthinobacterium agaricidamnosum NBRC 102515 = DSM 9628]
MLNLLDKAVFEKAIECSNDRRRQMQASDAMPPTAIQRPA